MPWRFVCRASARRSCTFARISFPLVAFLARQLIFCIFIGCSIALAQSPSSQASDKDVAIPIAAGTPEQQDASALLTEMATNFSSGPPLTKVQMTGNANWHAGSLEDTGSVTLTASSTGST